MLAGLCHPPRHHLLLSLVLRREQVAYAVIIEKWNRSTTITHVLVVTMRQVCKNERMTGNVCGEIYRQSRGDYLAAAE